MSETTSRMRQRLEYLRGKSPGEQARIISQGMKRRTGLSKRNPVISPTPAPAPPPEHLIRRPHLQVAGILDHFSHAAFQYEFRFESLRFETWRQQLEEVRPHLLFVESAWRGELDDWRYLIAGLDGPHSEFAQLVEWCRGRGIPTVFWNKEDPPNYLWFIGAAKLFDHVFTVDEGMLPRYERDLGHDRVAPLPFAAQPRIHSPVAALGRRDQRGVAFAGTYYRQKYPERRRQMEVVLDPARAFDLEIFTRVASDGNYRWPRKYEKHIVGTLPYEEMVEAYKQYRIFLNVGSVADSTTMCPRRIFELMATATVVLSSELRALDLLQNSPGLLRTSTAAETRALLQEHLTAHDQRARRQTEGLNSVLDRHTYGHRVDQILDAVGLAEPTVRPRELTVLTYLRDPSVDEARRLASLEAWAVMDGVAQVVVGDPEGTGIGTSRSLPNNVSVIAAGSDEDRWMKAAIDAAPTSHVARLDARHDYGPHFARDALRAFAYADVAAVGKGAYEEGCGGGRVLRHVEREFVSDCPLHSDTIVVERPVAEALGLPQGDRADYLERLRQHGVGWAATDRFGFVSQG